MANRKRAALLLGSPLVAGAVLVGTAAPAHADGPLEQNSATFTFTKTDGTQSSCIVTLSITTDYQNVSTQDLAGWSFNANTDCFNASLSQTLSWVSPSNTNLSASHSLSSPLPHGQQAIYSPVNANASTAKFTENVSMTFNNCMKNCTQSLSLTADGKA